MELTLIIVLIVMALTTLALLGVLIVMLAKRKNAEAVTSKELKAEGELIVYRVEAKTEKLSGELDKTSEAVVREVAKTNSLVLDHVKSISESSGKRVSELKESLEKGLSEVRATVGTELQRVRDDNTVQLDKMREVVNEKLDKTLNERLTQSFNAVSKRLEDVYKNLGEIQSLSSGMTDLRKMLSNIKTRGTFGEVSLENLLADTLSPTQYEKQCNVTGRGASQERVDFAILMPGKDEGRVLLPVDVKFPEEDFIRIRDAADAADEKALKEAERAFEQSVLEEGRRIRDKYVKPPKTTDFAVMYLPTEGLYGEVLKNEKLMQNLYKMHVVPSGPTTFTALLNALRMGFQSLQIQKESLKVFQAFKEIQKLLKTFNEQIQKVKENLSRAEQNLFKVSEQSEKIGSKLLKIELPDDPSLDGAVSE